jgi:hypothetical protein
MITKKNKDEAINNSNESNCNKFKNHKNIIMISHSKHKSVDLKTTKIQNILLSIKNRNNLKTEKIKSNSIKNNKKVINSKKEKFNSKTNRFSKRNNPKSKISNYTINSKNNLKSNKILKDYYSLPHLIDKNNNKKKYFFSPDFFRRKRKHKDKHDLNKRLDNSQKENININNSSFINNSNNNYSKGIIQKANYGKNIKENNNEKINNCHSPNNSNSSSDVLFNLRQPLIKPNKVNILEKISSVPYRNKRCTTSRIAWTQNDCNSRANKRKNESIIKSYPNFLEDSLESHNTICIDCTNSNDYEFIENNRNNNEKLYRRIIAKKRNVLTDSLNNSNLKNKTLRYHSTKNNTYYTSEKKSIMNNNINFNTQNLYRKVNSRRMSVLINKKNNINFFSSSALLNYDNKNKAKIIINKGVTEFLYSEDLIENDYQYKDNNLKNWLSNIYLMTYCQNFYENNIYDVDELIDKMKNSKNKNELYEYFENTFSIHMPGHIFRILLKLEIDSGLLDETISKFFVENEENRIKFNKIKPSVLLKHYNSCNNIFNYFNHNAKYKLKFFLKKYDLIHLYYNFSQNGFDLINYVLLQMFSNFFAINDYILENCFHIYNKNDRIVLLKSLNIEKNKIISFIKSDKKGFQNHNSDLIFEDINLNNNYNFDRYFFEKEYENNNRIICNIY